MLHVSDYPGSAAVCRCDLVFFSKISKTESMDTQKNAPNKSIWSAPFIILMLTNLFNMLGSFMTSTTLPVYLAGLGVDVAMVGTIVGAFAATAIGVRPFAGPAFDSFPRKLILLVTQVICALSLVGYALASQPEVLLGIRLFHGIGIGCSGPVAISLVGEFIPKSKLAQGISTYAVSTSAAQVVGPALGLFLVDAIGFKYTYLLASALVAAAIVCVTTIKEPHRNLLPYKVSFERTFAKEVLDKALVMALFSISFAAVGSYLVLMSREYGIDNVGFYFAIYALSLIVVAPQYGKMSDKFGPQRVLIVGYCFFALSFVMLHFAHSVPLLIVTAVISSLGYGASAPQIQSLAMSSVDLSRSAVVNNTHYTGLDVGMLVGPIIAGFSVEALLPYSGSLGQAYSNMWLVMLVPMTLGFLVVLYWNVQLNKKKRAEKECV